MISVLRESDEYLLGQLEKTVVVIYQETDHVISIGPGTLKEVLKDAVVIKMAADPGKKEQAILYKPYIRRISVLL